MRILFPLAIIMSTTITWADQADILGKIVGEGCRGKTAFYQGTMKDIRQPDECQL
jgi:hypothetical protein